MSNVGVLADPLGKVGDLGKQVSKGVGNEADKIEKTVKQQVVRLENQGEIDSKNSDNGQKQVSNVPSDKDTLEIVEKMYEKSNIKTNVPSDETIEAVIKENPKGTPEEIQKKASAENQFKQHLHKTTYFDPTFNPLKKQGEPRPAEEIEKEEKEKKQMEALNLQKEEKKKEELLSVTKGQGTHEKSLGISG